DAIRKGMDNLAAHINIVKQYGLPCVVAINSFPTDTAREIALLKELAVQAGAETVVPHNGFGQGGAGAVDLAEAVVAACDQPNTFKFLTPNGTPIVQQIESIATRLYGAAGIDLQMQAQKDLTKLEKLGMSAAPVCVAKTQMSLSHDPALRNRPTGFIVPVRALLPSAGAGFVVALCGDMQRMPGLGKTPAFQNIDIDAQGRTGGLFWGLGTRYWVLVRMFPACPAALRFASSCRGACFSPSLRPDRLLTTRRCSRISLRAGLPTSCDSRTSSARSSAPRSTNSTPSNGARLRRRPGCWCRLR